MEMQADVLPGPGKMDAELGEVLTATAIQMLNARADRVVRGL